jgi:hypothetical protein
MNLRFATIYFRLSAWRVGYLLALAFPFATLPLAYGQEDLRSLREGTHLFRRILYDAGLQPLQKMLDVGKEPEKTILIVLGDTRALADDSLLATRPPMSVEEFVQRGGAVLLAAKSFTPLRLNPLGVSILEEPLEVPASAPGAYNHHEDCILVQATQPGQQLLRNLKRVVTYQPGYIRHAAPGLNVLAQFPEGCYFPRSGAQARDLPFAVGGSRGDGRVLVLSDHSVFFNAVLWQSDNDNAFFAKNCADWLNEYGKRPQVLFFDGQIQRQFDIPLKPAPLPPLPPLEAIAQTVDEVLVGFEEEDRFNALLTNAILAVPQDALLRTIIVLATVVLAFYGLHRLSQARHRFEAGVPLRAGTLIQLLPRASLFDQRHGAMLRENNFWETAQALARHTLEPYLQTNSLEERSVLPTVQIQGSWAERRKLRRQVQNLWQLAYAAQPTPISARELKKVRAASQKVHKALAERKLQIGP